MPDRARPEALLERHILRAIGAEPDVLVCKNEVGAGYTGAVLPALLAALPSELHGAVRQALARHRITWGLGVGSPDLVASADGRWLGLELKSPDGRVSPEQRDWHLAAERRGALVRVVRSVDEARAAVDEARRGQR